MTGVKLVHLFGSGSELLDGVVPLVSHRLLGSVTRLTLVPTLGLTVPPLHTGSAVSGTTITAVSSHAELVGLLVCGTGRAALTVLLDQRSVVDGIDTQLCVGSALSTTQHLRTTLEPKRLTEPTTPAPKLCHVSVGAAEPRS